jgi:hypothetical protein
MVIKSLPYHTQDSKSHPKYLFKVLSKDGCTQLYTMSFFQEILDIWDKDRPLAFFQKIFN